MNVEPDDDLSAYAFLASVLVTMALLGVGLWLGWVACTGPACGWRP